MSHSSRGDSDPSPEPRAPSPLRWRCRRGMRELDVLLERYLQERYPCAAAAEQQAFEALLDLPDPQLFAYLMRRETPSNPEWVDVIDKLANADH
jgi:antitoxin CptB